MEFAWDDRQRDLYDQTLASVQKSFPDDPPATASFFTRDDWRTLGDLGVLGACVPETYGGGGLGALDTALMTEAFGRGCANTGLVFAAGAHLFACAMPIAEFGGEKLRFGTLPGLCSGELVAGNAMTERGAGSDVARLAVRAERAPGGWVLNGEKSFVSNGPAADIYVTYATTDPAAGHLGITAFVVERDADGVHAGEPLDKMGLLQCPAGTVRFTDCLVPDEQVIGEPGQGGWIFQQSMGWERSCLFAGYLGLADRILGRCVDHARDRRQFDQRLASFQAVSHRLAEMKLRVESARLLLYRACWEMDRGGRPTMFTALSKLAVSEGALACALDAVRVFGGRGYLRPDGVEAALRDTVPSVIFSGTSDVQRELIARELGL
ncbi:acyl-CoA dehydrogenase [Actinomadura soli]|uniref:Acyl-CoA dehydrogenase n=1 Tax=Actinomadura soli TaxID=2508997 RepID=A0A5C4JEI2_9ACTN|nr:acyl-CoA dehydrogenase family protein [Actinomadura soli]TMR02591.1 acyl-CoA dehydrogenase [Actinomadura soli]